MSLEGAKLICLNDSDSSQGDIILAQGRTFKFGYYMNSDVVLEHPDAMGLQCTIDCDAFGRVTIENRYPDQPITLDGKTFKKMRPLLHNTEICIFDKKYLWQFEVNRRQSGGFQLEDVADFTTPCKQMKKAEQPPMSEPARRWRTQHQKRLTIHSFAYCIKAGENPLDVEVTTDENKPLNTYEQIIAVEPAEPATTKRTSSPVASDLIDLKTPKVRKKSFAGRKTPLSCCKLSETVITSYSPRETGVRPEKSYAIVQSHAATPTKSSGLPDVSLGPFQYMQSPLTYNHRPSMHMIDLTTPMKLVRPASPTSTLLKSAFKKNIPKIRQQSQQLQPLNTGETSAASMESSVYSVHSTDDSVIELSDEGSFSPSPVVKTPSRPRTPQSLMKRAILSSAKKAATTKRLQQPPKPPPPTPITPRNPPVASEVRFQSHSTPQRKSLGRFQSPGESFKASQSVSGKATKSMVTSTPFRAGECTANMSKSSSILRSPSTSLTGLKNQSRVSLMLSQALSKSPQTISAQRRKSVTFVEATKSPCKSLTKASKSVSFLERIESEQCEDNQALNETFNMEEDQADGKNVEEEVITITTTSRKDATFSPEKEKCSPTIMISDEGEVELQDPSEVKNKTPLQSTETHPLDKSVSQKEKTQSNATFSPVKTENSFVPETPAIRKHIKRLSAFKPLPGVSISPKGGKTDADETLGRPTTESHLNVTFSPEKNDNLIVAQPKDETTKQTTDRAQSDTVGPQSTEGDQLDKTTQSTSESLKLDELLTRRTPQSSRSCLKYPKSNENPQPSNDILEDDDFESLDTIFKTPKARNLMILSSPKSISLQKPATDSVELIHSAEFDFSANLDDIFKTPQSEFITNRVEVETTPAENVEHFSPEEAFDMLVGRPISRRTYVRTTPPKKQESSPLKVTKDPTFPKTDIEEWIDNVNELLDDDHNDEDEMSYLTATTQGEFSRDPLMMSSFLESVSTAKGKKRAKSPKDESAMTIEERDEEEDMENTSALKDPLEMTVHTPKRSLSPNISGIDLLDHTSESLFSETLAVSDESSGKENEKTIGLVDQADEEETLTHLDGDIPISPDKARIEMEQAFENFEKERRIVESKRLISTPEPKKTSARDPTRRTMGNQQTLDVFFDLKALKSEREMELAFEKFEEKPSRLVGQRLVKTPDVDKPMRTNLRKTMGNQVKLEGLFDIEVAKAEREMELAFENFEEKPAFSEERAVQTPEPQKTAVKDQRRTMGSNLMSEVELDLKAVKAQREMELAFENFEEEPEFSKERIVQTPQPKKASSKDYRRTMGSGLVSEVKLDLQAAKDQREMELAFENFEEEPEFCKERIVQTPQPKKESLKDHRRTMGTSLVPELKLDLKAAKAQREMELAFENFEEEPTISTERVVQTPEPKKESLKDHRRTMGTSLVPEMKLDLKAAKAEREMELAFENFEEKPTILTERMVQTPEPKKLSLKDHRRTMGTSLVPEVKLDLKAAKAEREMELAFGNFEEEPTITTDRVVQTPEPKKLSLKYHRRTLGTSLVPEVKLDLKAAKAEREMELAFENFEEEPTISTERMVQTPEPQKASLKDHRRTMGTSLVPEVELDLKAAKAEREMDLAFENFEEEPTISTERMVQTPEPKKTSLKDHRRTMGTSLVPKVKLDLKAAKAEREMELAFENFEEEPTISTERMVQTPEPKKLSLKYHRRTLGTSLIPEVKLDLKAAKAEREIELAFENFEEEPTISTERMVQTPEPKKTSLKDHRRTMGTSLVPEVKLDLKAAKAEREMELAFENFEEEPTISTERMVQTPEPKKLSLKYHRRTLGTSLIPEVKLDLKAAKAEREMELAFENFEEEPTISTERMVQTPEPQKASLKDHRRTMGTSLVPEVELDLKAAKAEREIELAFENFEEEPTISTERMVQTPEPKKTSLKDHRRTMGTSLVPEVKLDLKAAKAEREIYLAFENFEEEPTISTKRVAQTPEPRKSSLKDHRRTMGSNLALKLTLDLKAAKAEREVELAFEHFEEQPTIPKERVVRTPELKKSSLKDHRRTMGSSLVSKVTLDLEAAKVEREMELIFENFKEEGTVAVDRLVKTPDVEKRGRSTRISLGYQRVSDPSFDPHALKSEREKEGKRDAMIEPSLLRGIENFESVTESNEDADEVLAANEVVAMGSKRECEETSTIFGSQDLVASEEVLLAEDETEISRSKQLTAHTINQEVTPQEHQTDVQSEGDGILSTIEREDTTKSKDTSRIELLTPSIDVVTHPRSRRKRQNTVDEESKLQENIDAKSVIPEGPLVEELPTPSAIQSRNRRRRRNTTDEDEKIGERQTAATPTISQPRSRRRRQNMIDDFEQLKDKENDDMKPAKTQDVDTTSEMKTQVKKRTTRKNSLDVFSNPKEEVEPVVPVEIEAKTKDAKTAVDEDPNLKGDETEDEVEQQIKQSVETSYISRKRRKNSTCEAELEGDTTEEHNTAMDSTSLDSTEDEAKSASSARKKRLRRVAAITTVLSQTEEETHHHLEPIAEEEKRLETQNLNQGVIADAGAKVEDKITKDMEQHEDDTKMQTKQSVETSSNISRKRRKNSNSDDDIQRKPTEEPNSAVDSTEDVSKHAPTTCTKRLRKTASITLALPQTEEQTHHHLEPIVEEEKRLSTPSTDQELVAGTGVKVDDSNAALEMQQHDDDGNSVESSSHPSCKGRKNSTIEDETLTEEQNIATQVDFTVDSTAASAQTEVETSHHLERIAEEENKLVTPSAEQESIADANVKVATRPVRQTAGRKEVPEQQEDVRGEDASESTPNLKPEVDEIISSSPIPSHNRIRGRRALLCVVLVESNGTSADGRSVLLAANIEKEDASVKESKAWQTLSVKLEPTEENTASESENTQIETEIEGSAPEENSDQGMIQKDPEIQAETTDVEDVIPSTPAPLKTRGRRLASKVESTESTALAMNRGRRGSTQQDNEVKVEEVAPSTPVPSETRGRRAALKVEQVESAAEKSTPVPKRARRGTIDTEIHTDEGAVPSSKTRGRAAVLKLKPSVSTAESSTPVRKRGRRGAVKQVSEVHTEQDDVDKGRRDGATEEDVEEVIQCTPVPLKIRGRRAAQKPEAAEPVSENAIPSQEEQRTGAIDEVNEVHPTESDTQQVIPSTAVDSTIEVDTNRDVNVVQAVEDVVLSDQQPAKTRRRKQKLTEPTAESSTSEVVQSTQLPTKTRGRRVAEKTELVKPVVECSIAEEVVLSTQALEHNSPLEVEHDINVQSKEADPEEVVASKTRGLETTLKVEPVEPMTEDDSTPENDIERNVNVQAAEANVKDVAPSIQAPPKARGRKAESSTTEVAQSIQMPLKTRGRRAVLKAEPEQLVAESKAEVRKGRRRGAVEEVTKVHSTAQDIEEVAQTSEPLPVVEVNSTTLPSKTLERKAVLKVEPSAESPTPVRRRARRGTIDTEIHTEDSAVPLSKMRGGAAELKLGPTISTAENSTPVRKRGQRRAVQQDPEDHIEEGKVNKVIPSKKPAHEVASQSESNVEQDSEIHTEEDDTEKVVPSKKRGRQQVLKLEPTGSASDSSTPARKRGRRGVAQNSNPQSKATEVSKMIQSEVSDVEEVILSSKPEPIESVAGSAPKIGRKGAAEHTGDIDSEAEKVVQSKKRGRQKVLKLEPAESASESSTPARKRGRRGVVQDDTPQSKVTATSKSIQSEVSDVEEVILSSKPELIKSVPESAPKRDRKGAAEHTEDIDSEAEKVVPSKKRGRQKVLKLEPTESASESSTPARKRGRRGVVQDDTPQSKVTATSKTIQSEVSDVEEAILSSKREPIESVPESAPKRDRKEAAEHTGDIDSEAEKVVPYKKRGRQKVLKLEPTESASESSTPARKRGRRGVVQDDTPQSKVSDTSKTIQSEVSDIEEAMLSAPAPSRGRGRRVKQKVDTTVESLAQGQKKGKKAITNVSINQGDDEKSEEEITDSIPVKHELGNSRPTHSRRPSIRETTATKTPQIVLEEEQIHPVEVASEKKSEKKPIRSRRLLSSTSPSLTVSEGEQTQSANTEEKSEKKPVRGRRAPSKKDTTVESTSHTEEEHTTSAAKKKPTRSRKPVAKVDTSSERENIKVEETKSTRGRNDNAKKANAVEVRVPSEDEVEEMPTVNEQPNKKTTRGRKGAQPKPEIAEENVSSSATTKTTRSRKAVTSKAAKDTDDEQSQSEAQKKPTRSRKADELLKEEGKMVNRNLEVLTDDETPRRLRRKPKILLSDEFVH